MLKYLLLVISFLLIISESAFCVGDVKPKYLWFDAEANFERFSNQDSIIYYLRKAKEVGFTDVVVDVKPIHGKVLYKSSFIPPLTMVNGFKREANWDYLGFFVDKAHELGLRLMVSTTIFPAGNPVDRTGWVYEDNIWDGKTTIQYKKDGTYLDIKDDKSKVAAFLNPLDPKVKDYVFRMIKEIVTNYDIDGYALDYCRFADVESDFSETSKKAFENYIGYTINQFPEDIYYYKNGERVFGPKAKEWFEFRSKVIHDYVKGTRDLIKSLKPHVNLEYWAASWYYSLYQNGQNWASKKIDVSNDMYWASDNYKNTGFAEYLDAFQIGTYLNTIYGKNDPESIEYGIDRGKKLVAGDTKVYGTIYALNHKNNIADAIDVCLKNSQGLMVFDIVQVIEFDLWNDIKVGIAKSNL